MDKMISVAAVRHAAESGGLSAVFRLLGPTPEENEEARKRLDRIRELDERCDWDDPVPDLVVMRARMARATLMHRQQEYEEKYF